MMERRVLLVMWVLQDLLDLQENLLAMMQPPFQCLLAREDLKVQIPFRMMRERYSLQNSMRRNSKLLLSLLTRS